MLTTSLEISLGLACAALAIAWFTLPSSRPRSAGPRPIQDYTPVDAMMWTPGHPHEAPETPFTVEQAHQTMQLHLDCKRGECPRKDSAWMTLVDAGHIKPAQEAW